ncbi:MAG TPA: nuclear transport factor 2 family protein [Gemmatimonadaceae bacterium]
MTNSREARHARRIRTDDEGCDLRGGGGRNTPADQQIRNVQILDIFGNTASVRAEMSGWIDYMHLARWNGEWKIVNVLWR